MSTTNDEEPILETIDTGNSIDLEVEPEDVSSSDIQTSSSGLIRSPHITPEILDQAQSLIPASENDCLSPDPTSSPLDDVSSPATTSELPPIIQLDSPYPDTHSSPPDFLIEADPGSSELYPEELSQRVASLQFSEDADEPPHHDDLPEDAEGGTEDEGVFDLRLEEILDANNFLFELRVEKPAIVELLRMAGVLEVLIDFACGYRIAAVKDAVDDAEAFQVHQRRSLVALQALEIDWILGIVIREDDLLDRLFNFLKTKINGQSDHVSSASFARVIELLFDRFANELVTYFQTRDWIVEHFVENVTDSNLMDLLYHFVDSRVTHQWLYEHSLIHFLVALFLYCHDPQKHEAASEVLVKIFTICQRWTDSALVNELFKKEEITDQLLQHASKVGEYQASAIKQGLSVVIAILSLLIMTDEEPTFVNVICGRLSHFVNLLRGVVPPFQPDAPAPSAPSESEYVRPATHDDSAPLLLSNREVVAQIFGSTRMKIVEFITTAMMCGYSEITQQLHVEGFFSICIDLFFTYKWNNFLHTHVDQILSSVLSSGDAGLIITMLDSTQFAQRIMANFSRADIGYRGHLVNIIREIVKISSENVLITDYFSALAGWDEFLSGVYQETEIRFQTQIGEILPLDWDSGSKEEHLFQLLSQIGGVDPSTNYQGEQYQDEIDDEYEHDYDEGAQEDEGSSEEEYPDHHGEDEE